MSEKLNDRKIYDVEAPNKSTGIINGESSNVLNWDDCRFDWAYPRYKKMLANFWTPFEINMATDVKQYIQLEPYEKEAFNKIIGLLAFLDSIQTDYSYKISNYLTDSSLNAIMVTIAFQEVVHNQSYSYVLSSVADKKTQDEVFEYWKNDPILRKRNDFIAKAYEKFVTEPTIENMLKSIVFDVILEGLNFYSGFAFFYNLARNQKMVATSTMINYINRDEQLHVDTFVKIFQQILVEYPEYNTPELAKFVIDTFKEAAELEIEWAHYIVGNKFDGINIKDLEAYIKFIANNRVNALGFERPFEGYRNNPMRWIVAYENVDLGKTDFFEQKSRQYTKVSSDNGFDDL